jgi:hypothetical protein
MEGGDLSELDSQSVPPLSLARDRAMTFQRVSAFSGVHSTCAATELGRPGVQTVLENSLWEDQTLVDLAGCKAIER